MAIFVKIMSEEDLPDSNTSKGFTLVPVPERGYFKFDRLPLLSNGSPCLAQFMLEGDEALDETYFSKQKLYPVLLIWPDYSTKVPDALLLTGNAYVLNDRSTIASFAYSKFN